MANTSLRSQVEALTLAVTALLAAQNKAVAPVAEPEPKGPGRKEAKVTVKAAKVYAPPSCTVKHNAERNGIEFHFTGPIAPPVVEYIRTLGMFYNFKTRVWYTKGYTPARFAQLTESAAFINGNFR